MQLGKSAVKALQQGRQFLLEKGDGTFSQNADKLLVGGQKFKIKRVYQASGLLIVVVGCSVLMWNVYGNRLLRSAQMRTLLNRKIASITQPPFHYEDSTPRPYCGVPVIEGRCEDVIPDEQPAVTSINDILRNFMIVARLPGSSNYAQNGTANQLLLDMVAARKEVLRSYWSSLYDRLGLPPDNLASFSFINEARIEYDAHVTNRIDILTRMLAGHVHRTLIRALTGQPTDLESQELLEAGSYWWAIRTLLIKAGCEDEQQGRIRQHDRARNFIQRQYGFQACRRNYMATAVARLNQISMTNGFLRIDSPEWLVMNMLGSRLERAELFATAITHLETQIRESVFPNRRELNFIANIILQTSEELRLGQVLTWNGLQNMSSEVRNERGDILSSDRESLKQQLFVAQRFFVTLMQSANTIRNENPSLYRHIGEVWATVYPAVNPEAWQRLGLASADSIRQSVSERDTHRVRCIEGNEVSCLAWESIVRAEFNPHDHLAPRQWESLLAEQNSLRNTASVGLAIRPRVLKILAESFYSLKTRAQGARARRAWVNAQDRITDHLKNSTRLQLRRQVPHPSDFAACLSREVWSNTQRVELQALNHDNIILTPQCSSQSARSIRDWTYNLLAFKKMNDSTQWYETPLGVAQRYAHWRKISIDSGARDPGHVFSIEERRNVSAQWSRFFSQPRRSTSENLMYSSFNTNDYYWVGDFSRGNTPADILQRTFSLSPQVYENNGYE